MTPIIGALFLLLLALTSPTSGIGGSFTYTNECVEKPVANCHHYGTKYSNACYVRKKFWPEGAKVGLSLYRDRLEDGP